MLLPLQRFRLDHNPALPSKASEIREILVEQQVNHLSSYLLGLYTNQLEGLPEQWSSLARPLSDL